MPRLSIVIPYLGRPPLLEKTLVSILENRPKGCEVIVVRSGRYDDPYDLVDEVRFVEAPGASPDVALKMGIEASHAPVIHLLACGVEVTPGWTDGVSSHFDDPLVAAVSPVVLADDSPSRVLSAGIEYCARGVVRYLQAGTAVESLRPPRGILGPDPAAGFYRKSALESAESFVGRLGPHGAVVDLALRLRRAGWHSVLDTGCLVVDSRKARGAGNAFRQAMEAERLFWRWATPLGGLTPIALHGLVIAAEVCLNLLRPAVIGRLAGRLVGWLTCPAPYRGEPPVAAPAEFETAGHAVPRPHFLDGSAGGRTASGLDQLAGHGQ